MPSWVAISGLSVLVAFAAACSAPVPADERPKGSSGGTEADPPGGPKVPGEPSDEGMPGGDGGGATSTGPLALVTIDTQQVFFDTAGRRNPKIGVPQLMTKTLRLFDLAKSHTRPLFVTFEASKTGDHALPPSLLAGLPAAATQLVKTTFAATGQPQFIPAIKASGATRLVVIGAETDVCVLQTVLGLRRAGFEVIAAVDALFTEEVNPAPALRRMRQAQITQLDFAQTEALLASGGPTPKPKAAPPPVIVKPLEIGFLLHGLESVTGTPASSPQMVRLRELLLLSEWFQIPLMAADPAKALASLPAAFRSILTRPIVALSQRPARAKQVAIAGSRLGIAKAVSDLGASTDTFLVEDTLVGGAAGDLEPLYVAGAVPSSYKTLYYELIQSVSDAEWPSPQWVTNGAKYYDLTMAPETLPQLPQ